MYIAGPVHINKNHWALLFVNMKAQAMMYIEFKGENTIISGKIKNWEKDCFTRQA